MLDYKYDTCVPCGLTGGSGLQGWANLPLKEQQYYLERDVQALSVMLGDKPFLSGTVPSEADATLFGYLDNVMLSLSMF